MLLDDDDSSDVVSPLSLVLEFECATRFRFGVFDAFRKKRLAGANPWGEGATTLEWQLSSPPPYHQWEQLPRIK